MALHPDETVLYGNGHEGFTSGALLFVDTSEFTLKNTTYGGERSDLAVNPRGDFVYDTSYYYDHYLGGSTNLSWNDAITGDLVGSLRYIGTDRWAGVAVHPSGDIVYVSANSWWDEAGKILFIETAGHTETDSLDLWDRSVLRSMVVHPEGRFLYGRESWGSFISVVDLVQKMEVVRIPKDDAVLDIALHPSGDLLYVSTPSADLVTVYDTANYAVVARIPMDCPTDISIGGMATDTGAEGIANGIELR